MKIDRLIGILTVLLQKDMITAPELAEKFEVSRRTISRDIEALCNAGIPIQTMQGVGGGISIMDGFKMDRTILTSRDMQSILSGLRSLDSVSGSRYYSRLMEKLTSGSEEYISGSDSILIDLSLWDKKTLVPKIDVIKNAIEERHCIRFRYYAPKGTSERMIEPYYLIFRWTSWYVYGWSIEKEACRLFKLNRMDKVEETGQKFTARNFTVPELSDEVFPDNIKLKAYIKPEMRWRLIEDYGINSFSETEDGRLFFERYFTNLEHLLAWVMTFGSKIEVIESQEVRDIIKKNAEEILRYYK